MTLTFDLLLEIRINKNDSKVHVTLNLLKIKVHLLYKSHSNFHILLKTGLKQKSTTGEI